MVDKQIKESFARIKKKTSIEEKRILALDKKQDKKIEKYEKKYRHKRIKA